MSQTPAPITQMTTQNPHLWVQHVPDGAVSVTVEDSTLLLKASNALQERFETLLTKQKDGTLSDEEVRSLLLLYPAPPASFCSLSRRVSRTQRSFVALELLFVQGRSHA